MCDAADKVFFVPGSTRKIQKRSGIVVYHKMIFIFNFRVDRYTFYYYRFFIHRHLKLIQPIFRVMLQKVGNFFGLFFMQVGVKFFFTIYYLRLLIFIAARFILSKKYFILRNWIFFIELQKTRKNLIFYNIGLWETSWYLIRYRAQNFEMRTFLFYPINFVEQKSFFR